MAAASPRPEVIERTIYECPTCNRRYYDRATAQACAERPVDIERYKVGDIVLTTYGYSWFDGSRVWIENKRLLGRKNWQKLRYRCRRFRNCSGRCCTLGFYYVVSKVDRDPEDGHRVRYHLATGALTPPKGMRAVGGYTFNEHHQSLVLVKRPPRQVLAAAKAFIGFEAGHLI